MITDDWFQKSQERRSDFLNEHLRGDVSQIPMTHDMAPRHYYRVTHNQNTLILLESAPDGHPQALPGHELGAFLKVAGFLKAEGFRVPEIFQSDEEEGLVLLEDFGDVTLDRKLHGASLNEQMGLYKQATKILLDLRQINISNLNLFSSFTGSRIDQGVSRFVHWFLPYYYGRPVSDDDIHHFDHMISAIKMKLPNISEGFVHGDFHPYNLMVLEDGDMGLLDFQAGMRGPCVYDLANLLHDARRHVNGDIIAECKDMYFKEAEVDLNDWYNYLALHFHLRVIGQFIKVAIQSGKTTYLEYLDLLWKYLGNNKDTTFQEYAAEIGLNFGQPLPALDLGQVETYIRPDAT